MIEMDGMTTAFFFWRLLSSVLDRAVGVRSGQWGGRPCHALRLVVHLADPSQSEKDSYPAKLWSSSCHVVRLCFGQ